MSTSTSSRRATWSATATTTASTAEGARLRVGTTLWPTLEELVKATREFAVQIEFASQTDPSYAPAARASRELERLDTHPDLSTFDSGNDELDGWLQRHGLAAQQMDSARTFVLTKQGLVVGYFSLTMGSVLRQDAPAKLVRGLPAYPVGMVNPPRASMSGTASSPHRDTRSRCTDE